MDIPPQLLSILKKLGVNTTALNWKLHQWELRRNEPKPPRELPTALRWLRYRHKFCPECNGLVHHEDAVCPSCGAAVPSRTIYMITRAIGLIAPKQSGIVVMTFIGVMLALFVYSAIYQGPKAIMSPSMETLYYFGIMERGLVEAGDLWRIFSFGLIHGGIIHIFFNGTWLVQIGPWLESEIGPRRMLVLITITQLTSAIAVLYGGRFVVGASGWLFGLIGFGAAYFHRAGRAHHGTRNHFITWGFYGLMFGFIMPGISNLAHGGGLVGGILLGFVADVSHARRTAWTRVWEAMVWPCAAIWIATLFFLVRSIIQS